MAVVVIQATMGKTVYFTIPGDTKTLKVVKI